MDRRIIQAVGGVAVAVAALWAGVALVRRARALRLEGAVAVVTGGSRGLGLVLASRLAAKGALLALLARDHDELRIAAAQIAARGGSVLALTCDVTSRQEVEDAVAQIIEFYGRIDLLINNAGIIQVGPMEHMTDEDYEQAWAVHVRGPLNTVRAVVPHMKRAGGGRIVNIASIGGQVAVPHLLPYTMSKFGLVGLSDGLRAELRRHQIRVTTVVPGTLRTGSPPNALFKGRHCDEYAWFAVASAMPVFSTGADRAARRILRAARYGTPNVTIGLPARLAVKLNAVMPNLSGILAAAVNALLPGPLAGRSRRAYRGWQSGSRWAPSKLTWLSDRASQRNNEAPAPPPDTPPPSLDPSA